MPTDTKSELAAILTGAAIFLLDDRAFLRITGSDAARWLNGMVTNSIQPLAPGEGNYNFLLNAQGRIQGDCTIYRDSDADAAEFILETDRSQVAAIQQHLDRFIIMDDVELLPIMDDQHGLLVVGPNAAARLTSLSLPTPEPVRMARATYAGQPILITVLHAPLVPRYEIWASPDSIAALRIALEAAATTPVSLEAVEQFHILEGRPRFGVDIRDRDLPQETNQTHALHFSKGCYLGQEIVERIRSRGQVHRTFSAFRLSALPAALPTPLSSDGNPAGELTSAATIGDQTFALGYGRREAVDRNQPLAFENGTAIPTSLPFQMTTS
jgi:folate-binding protein YgfZ